MTDHAFDII